MPCERIATVAVRRRFRLRCSGGPIVRGGRDRKEADMTLGHAYLIVVTQRQAIAAIIPGPPAGRPSP